MAEGTPIHEANRPKGNIFIAHAREDERAVECLRRGLNRYVDATWHSHPKFPELAADQPQGVAAAVRDCDILLSVFSRATAAKGDDYSWLELIWVEKWEKISPEGKNYVAVLIDDGPVPARRETHAFPDVEYIRLPEGEVSPQFGAQIRKLLVAARSADEDKYATRIEPPPQLSVPVAEPKAPEKPLVHDENVQFTVYRPKIITPQKWHTLLAFAHLSEKAPDASPDDPDPVAEVARQAKQILGETDAYGQTTQDSTQAIPREGEITMVPVVEGIMFNPSRHTFLWTEPVHREEFRLRMANAALPLPAVLRGRLTIYLGGLIIAEIPLKFQAEPAARSLPAENLATAQARPYRKIFASYSHQDAPIVEHIEHYANAVGDCYLRDAVNLRSGQDWNAELMRMIGQADIFQLFWSSNSMRSKYCRQEWEYALGLNRPSFIRPTYWEEPFPQVPHESLPPDALRSLHFQRIVSSRLPVAPPKPVLRTASPSDDPPSLQQDQPRSSPRRRERTSPAGIGSGSTSIDERILQAQEQPVRRPKKASAGAGVPTSRSTWKPEITSSSPPPSASSAAGRGAMLKMRMSPSAQGRAPGGGRKAGKIALLACLAVVAIGGFCFQYGRQNTMTASASSRQDAQRQLDDALHHAQLEQETASAQKASSDVGPATGQNPNNINSTTAPAAGFDTSPQPQVQTADASTATNTAAATNAPQITQDQPPQPTGQYLPPAAAPAMPGDVAPPAIVPMPPPAPAVPIAPAMPAPAP